MKGGGPLKTKWSETPNHEGLRRTVAGQGPSLERIDVVSTWWATGLASASAGSLVVEQTLVPKPIVTAASRAGEPENEQRVDDDEHAHSDRDVDPHTIDAFPPPGRTPPTAASE